ncbi:secreted protein, partial [methanotrophic bacterial endosymbiont of Bathymodiolus sp.]
MKSRLIIVLLMLSLSGCFTVPLEAAYGQDVKI